MSRLIRDQYSARLPCPGGGVRPRLLIGQSRCGDTMIITPVRGFSFCAHSQHHTILTHAKCFKQCAVSEDLELLASTQELPPPDPHATGRVGYTYTHTHTTTSVVYRIESFDIWKKNRTFDIYIIESNVFCSTCLLPATFSVCFTLTTERKSLHMYQISKPYLT